MIGYAVGILAIIFLFFYNKFVNEKMKKSLTEKPSPSIISKNEVYVAFAVAIIGVIAQFVLAVPNSLLSLALIFIIVFLTLPFYKKHQEISCPKCGSPIQYSDSYVGKYSLSSGSVDIVDEKIKAAIGENLEKLKSNPLSPLLSIAQGLMGVPEVVQKINFTYIIKRTYSCSNSACDYKKEKYLFIEPDFIRKKSSGPTIRTAGISLTIPWSNLRRGVRELAESELGEKLAKSTSLESIGEAVRKYPMIFKFIERDRIRVI